MERSNAKHYRDKGAWSPSQVAIRRSEKRKPQLHPQLNLWGLASVMLTILSLFTADLVPEQRRQPPLDLPKTQTAAPQPLALRDDAMLVSVTRDGRILFGNYEVSLEVLQHRIETQCTLYE